MLVLKRPEGAAPEDFHLSRRTLGAMAFAGYAAAALSADAEPIHTDEAGLVTETVMLPTAGQSIRGFIARPKAPGRFPVVIVVNEVFGLHEYIRDVCRRFAKLGYVAIAPGFFDRAGDPAPLTDFGAIMKIVATASDAQVLDDVGSTLKYLKTQTYVDKRAIAITGFCWGGGVVWLACEQFTDLKAGVAWYGRMALPAGQADDGKHLWPIQRVAQLNVPVLGLYGGKDPLAQAVPAMRAALKAAGKTSTEIVVYDDAGHGFHADYRASYNEIDAKDGWKRLLAFFAAHGVPPRAFTAA